MYKRYHTFVKEKELLIFITQDDLSIEDEIKINQLCENLSEDTEATVVVIPERVVKDAKKLDIESLIQLREVFDKAIQDYIERESIPE